jgi:hypothetical protein
MQESLSHDILKKSKSIIDQKSWNLGLYVFI